MVKVEGKGEYRVQSTEFRLNRLLLWNPELIGYIHLYSVLSLQGFHPALEHIRRGDGVAEETQGFPQGVVIAMVIGH